MSIKAEFILCLLFGLHHGAQIYVSGSSNCLKLPTRVHKSIIRLLSHNETRSSDGSFQPGSRVHYHCAHKVYSTEPDGRVICTNGTWVGKRPKCKSSYKDTISSSKPRQPVLSCESLPKLFQGDVRVHGVVESGDKGPYPDGTHLTFSCRIGHLSPRSSKLICKNGTWQGTLPRCAVSQCVLPADVPGGAWSVVSHNPLLPIVQRGWILEDVRIEYVCQPGLTLVGSKWRDCSASGKWTGYVGMCLTQQQMYDTCKSPGNFPNGRITCKECSRSKTKFYISTVLEATCLSGYGMLEGEKTIEMHCTYLDDDMTKVGWSRRMPRCISNEELAALNLRPGISNASLWSQDLTVVIAVSTVVMGGLLMIFTAVLACRCVRHAASGRRGRASSPLHHHHPYTVSAASVAAGHRNEDCVALIVPPSYEEAVRDGGPIGATGSMGTPGPASTMTSEGVNNVTMAINNRGGNTLHGSRFAHVLSRSPRIRTSGEGRDYRPLVQTSSGSRQSRRAAAAAAAAAASMGSVHHQQVNHHHHGSIPASSGEADSVSRHSTQTSGSHGPAYCLSGSLETMAVSDGTSVTLRTYESQHGSNPSLISTRPQTGSLCEPQQTCQSTPQQMNTRGGSDTPGSNGGSTNSDVTKHVTQTSTVPIVGGGNGNGCGTGYISAGSVVGSEKEDSLSTRS